MQSVMVCYDWWVSGHYSGEKYTEVPVSFYFLFFFLSTGIHLQEPGMLVVEDSVG